MMEGMITLTKKEQRTNDVLVKLISKEIKNSDAARLLGLNERQIYRKKKNYLTIGITSVQHKSKNKTTGKGIKKEVTDKILMLYKEEYLGWNFYHFNDYLEDYHNVFVSDSFIYKFLTKNHFTSPNAYKNRKKESHPPRERKKYAGELIQVDASKHQWFYNDSNFYHLHGAIDDSTGIVTGCFFAKEETIFGYQMMMYQTIKNYGLPECLYTDFRTVFQSNKKELTLEEELEGKEVNNTRFANMLKHLGVGIISTMNPRAKGRIERLWRTFQDRLYKELKKENITTMDKANDYLENIFIPKYNTRFSLEIDFSKNRFISPVVPFDFNSELAVWKNYAIHNNCYLNYDKNYKIILEEDGTNIYIKTKEKVRVYTFLDGTVKVLYKDKFYHTRDVKIMNIKEAIIKASSPIEEKKERVYNSKNSPWRKSLPQSPSVNSMKYAYFHGC